MSKDKHILFLVPDGVGIKNYLYSNIITHLKGGDAKITIWSPLPIEAFNDVKKLHQLDFGYKQIELKPESSLTRLYREATTYARLRRNAKLKNNPTILTNWRKPKYGFKVKLLYKVAEILGGYIGEDYTKILKFEEKSKRHIASQVINNYVDELQALNPTAIFITHQRVSGIMPICLAAERLNINTITAIFSWDNLPKARLCVKANNYLVWGDWMLKEMAEYYPEIPSQQVKLVGTPQFEFYTDNSQELSRKKFAVQHGLDPNKKWVCFSGDDITTSPHDAIFLDDVAKALMPYADGVQLIFRRCPVDFSERYDVTIKKYNNVIRAIDPLWYTPSDTGWTGYFASYKDISIQVNLAKHCETVINLGSTMAHDFTMFNKPCLYLNYNPVSDENWNVNTIYNYQHFRSMEGLNAVGWLNSKADIAEVVLKAINTPEVMAPDRKLWMQRIVLQPVNESSKLIAKLL